MVRNGWLDDVVIIHSSRKKIDESLVVVFRSNTGIDSFFLVLFLSHSEESKEQAESNNDETNHELHDFESKISLLFEIEFLVEGQSDGFTGGFLSGLDFDVLFYVIDQCVN